MNFYGRHKSGETTVQSSVALKFGDNVFKLSYQSYNKLCPAVSPDDDDDDNKRAYVLFYLESKITEFKILSKLV